MYITRTHSRTHMTVPWRKSTQLPPHMCGGKPNTDLARAAAIATTYVDSINVPHSDRHEQTGGDFAEPSALTRLA